MNLTVDQIGELLANRDETINALDKADSEDKLIDFIRLHWHILEPGRQFIDGYAVHAICDHLEAITDGHIQRLLMNVPPGTMKSLTSNVFWPAWEWGPKKRPSLRYVTAAYSQDLTIRDNRRTRALIKSTLYQQRWGMQAAREEDRIVEINPDQDAKTRFDTMATGFKIASSVGGLSTGERGDRFIIDDPHNIKDGESEKKRAEVLHWFTEVVPTRINDPRTSARVIIMQRTHEQDVSGLILAKELDYVHLMLPMEYEVERKCYTCVVPKWMEKPEKVTFARLPDPDDMPAQHYTVAENEYDSLIGLNPEEANDLRVRPLIEMKARGVELEWQDAYPADWRTKDGDLLWAERFPQSYLDIDLKPSLRAWGGFYAEAGQLQQRPTPRGGGMFQRSDFHIVDLVPDLIKTVRGWDFAGTKDGHGAFTVALKMGMTREKQLIILDVRRDRWSPGEVDAQITLAMTDDGPGIEQSFPQDPGQAGKAQKVHIAASHHGGNMHSSLESGEKSDRARPLASQAEMGNLLLLRAHWNDALIAEFCSFPMGLFKDQVDAGSRAYMRLMQKKPMLVGVGPRVVRVNR